MSASGGLAMVVVAISISIYFRNLNLPQEINPWAEILQQLSNYLLVLRYYSEQHITDDAAGSNLEES